MKNKIMMALAALLVVAACENKPLGWPAEGESYFDKYKNANYKYPTNLQADLQWPGETYPGESDYLHYYFFDKDGRLIHYGMETAKPTPVADVSVNWKNHIDSVHTDCNGIEHYKGKYNVVVSENSILEIIDDKTLEYEVVTGDKLESIYLDVPVAVAAISREIPVGELGFSGMNVNDVFQGIYDFSGYYGFRRDVICGSDALDSDGKYLTTNAPVTMNKWKVEQVRAKILNDNVAAQGNLMINRYAFADGIVAGLDLGGLSEVSEPFKPVTVYLGCEENGEWTPAATPEGMPDGFYTAAELTYGKPAGKLYLFCDFFENVPGDTGYITRFRVCQIVDYNALVQHDDVTGWNIVSINSYPSGSAIALDAFMKEYCPEGIWRTDVTYPVTRIISE